ncbi:CD3072 family TudS-related putative desulfidase [Desnuesiella massiliensis]|uniref:CD3072 family TudS-related putative desulfidase n=1 Tax=Desnuesiella massiliensis TaxID=1650662 RepID=UPI0006E175BA|nr:CD3072 family TudS-related putative desulfidase [Desnuesiella massiliensis]
MDRNKKLIIVSHCILNQNSVVAPLARAKGPFPIAKIFLDMGVGVLQLPCPEFKFLGPTRVPMSKEEYDTKEYRELCKNLFIPIIEDIKKYISAGYEIKGIIGINESPTCSITGNRGIFMEEIFKLLEKEEIFIDYLEVPTDYSEDSNYIDFEQQVLKLLK